VVCGSQPIACDNSATVAPSVARSNSIACANFVPSRGVRGVVALEPVELHRVFPAASAMPGPVRQDAQTDALVLELRAQLAELRAQRDAWQGIAERLALSAPKPSEQPPEPKSAEAKRRSWWLWRRVG
jgi:hypothetical protein